MLKESLCVLIDGGRDDGIDLFFSLNLIKHISSLAQISSSNTTALISYYSCWFRSELVEGLDVNGLDFILEGGDSFLNEIGGDLFIFDDSADNDLENTVGNGLLLVFGFPCKTIHSDGKNLSGESIQISLLTPWLDFPNNDGFGNWGCLFLGSISGFTFGLHGLSSGSVSSRVLCKWVEFFLSSSGGGFCSSSFGFASFLASFFLTSL